MKFMNFKSYTHMKRSWNEIYEFQKLYPYEEVSNKTWFILKRFTPLTKPPRENITVPKVDIKELQYNFDFESERWNLAGSG